MQRGYWRANWPCRAADLVQQITILLPQRVADVPGFIERTSLQFGVRFA